MAETAEVRRQKQAAYQERYRRPPTGTPLTPSERRLLALIADGYTTVDTARLMGIGRATCVIYRLRVLSKLGARNTPHAVALAYEHGVLPAGDAR